MVAATDDFPSAGAHAGIDVSGDAAAHKATANGAVDFGWEDGSKKVTGRRRKAAAKTKAKPGSFGEQRRAVSAVRCRVCGVPDLGPEPSQLLSYMQRLPVEPITFTEGNGLTWQLADFAPPTLNGIHCAW